MLTLRCGWRARRRRRFKFQRRSFAAGALFFEFCVMALDHSCQVQRHPHAERGLDLYETPVVAVEALLRVEKIPRAVWEPAAGRGAIARVLRERGHTVVTSDIVARDFPLNFVGEFLAQTEAPVGGE